MAPVTSLEGTPTRVEEIVGVDVGPAMTTCVCTSKLMGFSISGLTPRGLRYQHPCNSECALNLVGAMTSVCMAIALRRLKQHEAQGAVGAVENISHTLPYVGIVKAFSLVRISTHTAARARTSAAHSQTHDSFHTVGISLDTPHTWHHIGVFVEYSSLTCCQASSKGVRDSCAP